MSGKIKDGDPAFPIPMVTHNGGLIDVQYTGMSLRDWFAGMALQGMMTEGFIPNQVTGNNEPQFDYSRSAYRMADAMIAEREKVKP